MEIIIKSLRDKGGIYRFIRFCIVGAINTGIDVVIFFGCYHYLSVPLSLAQVLGYGSGMISSYLLNSIFTFKNKGLKNPIKIIGFLVVNGISLGCSIIILEIVMRVTGVLIISKFMAIVTSLIVNYIGQKKIFIEKEANYE